MIATRLAAVLAVVGAVTLPACGGCGGSSNTPVDAGPPDSVPFTACGGDPASFVRQTFLALDGRRPLGEAEVDVYVDLYNATATRGDDPKAAIATAILARPELAERWVDVVMDAMHVQRVDIQNEESCWGEPMRTTTTKALATAIRDQPATGTGDGQPWTMIDLARSAVALDDLTPIYRAQLFSLVSHPIPAANVAPIEAELARRADFGATFDSGFLHRDIVCLACHTSAASVTDNDDPKLDRFWPVPGLPEKPVYGAANGEDIDAAHGVFRTDSFVDAGHVRPWGWSDYCGEFAAPASVPNDLAGITAKLASITGQKATVYDLEASLDRGFTALRGHLPPLDDNGAIADPDTALAWLVTLKMTEDVWKAVTGTPLTIANYFPRNAASSDVLYSLATTLTQSGYSPRALLAAIVATDYFNRKTADQACGAGPYSYPNVFDPWVISDPDPTKQLNGPGDAVTAIDARTLVSAANAALEWTAPMMSSRFPDFGETGCDTLSCADLQVTPGCSQTHQTTCTTGGAMLGVPPSIELPFERGVGMFLRNSERGFRGLDFQARLSWEDRYGACARPAWVASDFIDRLVAAGTADPAATSADLVAALKDRMMGEPTIADGPEHDALTAMIGALTSPASAVTAAQLRAVCGALIESPQFLLQGIAGAGGAVPRLTPSTASYATVCGALATTGVTIGGANVAVTCTAGTLALAPVTPMMRVAPSGVAVAAPAEQQAVVRKLSRHRGLPPARRAAPTMRTMR